MSVRLTRRELIGISGALAAGLSFGGRDARGASPAAASPPAAAPSAESITAKAPIRLSFNENPYGPAPAARAAIAAAVSDAWQYPVLQEIRLRALIAEREGLTPREVMIGHGSSEILHIAAVMQGLPKGELVTAVPSFDLVAQHARTLGAGVREVPLDGALRLDLPALRAAVSPDTRLIYLCNPNNPTGTLLPGAALREFVASLPDHVVALVDEAYLELSAEGRDASAIECVKRGDNVIVARTFSKLHGLAGLRVGYALARPDLAERLNRLKSATVNNLGLAAATASYRDLAFQDESRGALAQGVTLVTSALDELGLRHTQTRANFVFFDTGVPIAQFLSAMRARGFELGRPFPPYATWCRVSMGTVEQMRSFAAALRAHYAR